MNKQMFRGAKWDTVDGICRYYAITVNENLEERYIVLQSTVIDGNTFYRWQSVREGHKYNRSRPFTDKTTCVDSAYKWAADNCDSDLTYICREIKKTGYFGDAPTISIMCVCVCAAQQSKGYMFLPKGNEIHNHSSEDFWSMECNCKSEHIKLPVSYVNPSGAAEELLRLINECK